MKIVFLGVGEAFDENQPNSSILVKSGKTNILLDCGFTVPPQVWRYNTDPDFLDAVYISHQHADHFFGLPALLLRMWECGRTRPFTIICQRGLKDSFTQFMNFAYKGFRKKFGYQINIIESRDNKTIKFNNLNLSFEKTIHSGENLAVKIVNGNKSFVYGGDGEPLRNTGFYQKLDLLVLETYFYDQKIIGHSSMISVMEFAKVNNAKLLAMTHINRDLRRDKILEIKNNLPKNIIIPEIFEEIIL